MKRKRNEMKRKEKEMKRNEKKREILLPVRENIDFRNASAACDIDGLIGYPGSTFEKVNDTDGSELEHRSGCGRPL